MVPANCLICTSLLRSVVSHSCEEGAEKKNTLAIILTMHVALVILTNRLLRHQVAYM